MQRQFLGEFSADGSDGVKYIVKMFRSWMPAGSTFEDTPPSSAPEDWEFVASVPGIDRGYHVGRLQKGKYKFVDADTTLTSSDPAAP